ncbi:MAG: LexA family transcriptional regulator [Deltaproteobacteria bacterium]|nr:MAG: LexA family transcriptional regulator [Deltaproteobacteria bacterium]
MEAMNSTERKEICNRVKQIRIKHFGDAHGSQKDMAKAMGIPYTTYRGYEEDRVNIKFIKSIAEHFNEDAYWIIYGEPGRGLVEDKLGDAVMVDPKMGPLQSGRYRFIQLMDDSMEPNIKPGTWVALEPVDKEENLIGKLIGIWSSEGKLTIRRASLQGKSLLATTDNPKYSAMVIKLSKTDIVGKVVWQFSVV